MIHTTTVVWWFGISFYLTLLYYSLLEASSPIRSCSNNDTANGASGSNSNNNNNVRCFRPIIHVGDNITFQLQLLYPPGYEDDEDVVDMDEFGYKTNDTNDKDDKVATTSTNKNHRHHHHTQYRWISVPSCRIEHVQILPSGKLPKPITQLGSQATATSKPDININETSSIMIDTPTINHTTLTTTANSTAIEAPTTASTRPTTNICSVPIPMFARQRSSSSSTVPSSSTSSSPPPKVQPLKARFVVYFSNNSGGSKSQSYDNSSELSNHLVLLTTIPFELTKIVKRRRRRKIKRDQNQATTKMDSEIVVTEDEYVPYLKYGRNQPIRIRYVSESRGYATVLKRSDGYSLFPFNTTHYRPIMYVDELALLRGSSSSMVSRGGSIELATPDDAQKMSKPPIDLVVKFNTISPIVDTINQQVISQFEFIEQNILGVGGNGDNNNNNNNDDDGMLDEIRYMLSDERLYRFIISQIITTVHVWLDYLAFRDEVRFYSTKNKSMGGISTTTAISQLICSIIIFLYLLDGGGTSWIVLFSVGSSVVVDAWKTHKILKPTFTTKFPFVVTTRTTTATPKPHSTTTEEPSTTTSTVTAKIEEDTAMYDKIAIRYMSWILYPLVGGLALHSLKYDKHESWYSWFISSAADGVYTFGFITLCPQLYINYRLKSVAHMPWKVFVYKIFNTFVDDAFAFLIEAPWKHRLMTLRDDVIFLIFLYQAYIYKVDKTRVNEYGYCYEEDKEEERTDKGEDRDGRQQDQGHDDDPNGSKLKRE